MWEGFHCIWLFGMCDMIDNLACGSICPFASSNKNRFSKFALTPNALLSIRKTLLIHTSSSCN